MQETVRAGGAGMTEDWRMKGERSTVEKKEGVYLAAPS